MGDRHRKKRSEQVREQNRRALAWGLVIAAVLHVAFFALSPTWEAEPSEGWTKGSEEEAPEFATPVFVRISFGPPAIEAPDGTIHQEPADRMLEAERLVRLPEPCREEAESAGELPSGSVRLRVNAGGRVTATAIEESTGLTCGDELITMVADALWYRWLPSERHPAPVELVQPVTLLESATAPEP